MAQDLGHGATPLALGLAWVLGLVLGLALELA